MGLLFMLGVAMVLLFLLTLATDNQTFYEANFARLVGINVAVALLLLLVIVGLAVRLVLRLRRRRFGSQLMLKLATIFSLVGFLPGLLIYVVSYQFVSRSIENWFDVRVETALNAGLNLGRTTLDTLAADLANKTRMAAADLAGSSDAGAVIALERLREQLSATDLVLWSSAGQAVASAGESRFKLSPERPSPAQMRSARHERVIASIEGLEEQDLASSLPGQALPAPRIRVLALVASPGFGLQEAARFLEASAPLPPLLVADALAVQVAHREYQERALARDGLRRLYIGTLTLALFLAVFGAVLLAVLLGNQLVRPLLMLAAGMRDVARGDLGPKLALSSRDELAGLTRDFAHMTQELADARQSVQSSMQQVDTARSNLQTILDNLTAGVVVLDANGCILSANPGAARILRAPLAAHQWQGLHGVPGLESFAQGVQQQFDRFLGESWHEGGHWQQSFELRPPHADAAHPGGMGNQITLIARGALLPQGDRLLVFDDVSEIISAQRAQAWGEVARRLAHEIKNPLTPIQLSAERLAMKLAGKLEGADAALLTKSVRTIVDQVDAMKRLVNEFRDYARLPAAQLVPVDLNALIADILGLYDPSAVPVRLDLAPCPSVLADAQQVRQVIHNLVQNAQDATPPGAGPVLLQTRLTESGRRVRLVVQDCGPGFPEAILKRAFEPYVTTKTKGTGLGLAVVKKIMDEHRGRVDIAHRMEGDRIAGARVSLSFMVADTQQDEATS
ncbi:ATP-binding protein [Malikia sp.]|uniref:sensor histidine kinase n=1 Tax=Malikia sp. TaxID=2070706 RepID=UPI0026118A54|nr:ATP-binding protein [Malikia sp.]MDD2730158.1 ATP-binding protein [Malikia sp.]